MLTARRFVAVLFLLLFSACLIAVIVAVQVIGKVADPGYVPSRLRDADAYDFLYDDVMGAVLSDRIDRGLRYEIALAGGAPVVVRFDDTEAAKRAVRGLVEGVVPREFLQDRVETILIGTLSYMYGRSDQFELDPKLPDMVRRVPQAVRVAAGEIRLGETLSRDVIGPIVRAAAADFTAGPLGIAFTPDEAADAARRVAPPGWMERQLFATVDEVAPYFAGDRGSFAVNISFRDRVPVVADILKGKVEEEGGAVDLLFEKIVNPMVMQFLDSVTVLPFQVPITDEEVTAALVEVAPREWVQEQAVAVIDEIAAYLVGESDRLTLSVDLVDRKRAAVRVVGELAQSKLEGLLGFVPRCRTAEEGQRAAAALAAGGLPACIDEGAGLQALLDTAMVELLKGVRDQIFARVPDQVTYTDADFRNAVGPEMMGQLDDLRRVLREGLIFTSDDMIGELSRSGDREDVERMLRIVRGEAIYTQDDFEKDYRKWTAEAGGPELETVRKWTGRGLTLRWVVFLGPALLLLIVAFLGGRGWYGRLKWAAWGLFGTSVAAAVAFGPVFRSVMSANAERWFDVPLSDAAAQFRADWPATAALIESGVVGDKIEAMIGDIVGSMLTLSVVCLIVSLLALAFAYLWPLRERSR